MGWDGSFGQADVFALSHEYDEFAAEEQRLIGLGRIENSSAAKADARANLNEAERKALHDNFFAGRGGKKAKGGAVRAFNLFKVWALTGYKIIDSWGRASSDLSVLDARPDQKVMVMGAFLIHCTTVLKRKCLQSIVRGLKDHYLARVEQANLEVFESHAIKRLTKEAKQQNLSVREASAKTHSQKKQAVPLEVLEENFALLHQYVTRGRGVLPNGDIWNVMVAAACIYSYVFATRISEVGASGDEDGSDEGAQKHTLKCKEVLFRFDGSSDLHQAGYLPRDVVAASINRMSFLRRSGKQRAHTIASTLERLTLSPEDQGGRYTTRCAKGELSHEPFGPYENNLFLDALIKLSSEAGVQDDCYFFSRQHGGTLKELKAAHINEHLKEAAKRWGLSSNHFSSHSLKKAHVQSLEKGGFSDEDQQISAGHASACSTAYYRRKIVSGSESAIFSANAARTVAEARDEQQHLHVGAQNRAQDEKKRKRVEREREEEARYY